MNKSLKNEIEHVIVANVDLFSCSPMTCQELILTSCPTNSLYSLKLTLLLEKVEARGGKKSSSGS